MFELSQPAKPIAAEFAAARNSGCSATKNLRDPHQSINIPASSSPLNQNTEHTWAPLPDVPPNGLGKLFLLLVEPGLAQARRDGDRLLDNMGDHLPLGTPASSKKRATTAHTHTCTQACTHAHQANYTESSSYVCFSMWCFPSPKLTPYAANTRARLQEFFLLLTLQ